MQILNDLTSQLDGEQSMFRAQLMREDIARLQKLLALAAESADLAGFKKSGTYIGWTQNDMMTHVVAESLGKLLEAIYAYQHQGTSQQLDASVSNAWMAFCEERNEKLIKCL